MENKKQTAVEWLYEKMYIHKGLITTEEYNQAMQMEKDQLAEKDKVIEMFAIEFAEWFIKNTGKYTDDILALRQGKYIELYKQSLNK